MAYKVPWEQVYPGITNLPPKSVKSVYVDVLKEDADAIMSVALNPSIFSFICQTAIHAVAQDIKTNQFNYGDAERLIDRIRKRAAVKLVEDPNAQDDTRGKKEVCARVENGKDTTTRVGEAVKTKRGDKGTKREDGGGA